GLADALLLYEQRLTEDLTAAQAVVATQAQALAVIDGAMQYYQRNFTRKGKFRRTTPKETHISHKDLARMRGMYQRLVDRNAPIPQTYIKHPPREPYRPLLIFNCYKALKAHGPRDNVEFGIAARFAAVYVALVGFHVEKKPAPSITVGGGRMRDAVLDYFARAGLHVTL